MILQVNFTNTKPSITTKISEVLATVGNSACEIMNGFWFMNVSGTVIDWSIHIRKQAQLSDMDNLIVIDISASVDTIQGNLDPETLKKYETWRKFNGLGMH